MKKKLILVINPGSTSTKMALFEEDLMLFEKNLKHSSEEILKFARISDQFEFRKKLVVDELKDRSIVFSDISAVVGRGGVVKPIESGIYLVNEQLKSDLISCRYGEHASNLGGLIASDIASSIPGAKAFIVDPVVVDEMEPVARISGHPKFERKSIFHALNHKSVARKYAYSIEKKYEDLNIIVAHMGGGVSVAAHRKGRVIDVNNALDGGGPFSPERSGSLPTGQLVSLCFSGEYALSEVKLMLNGKGGMVAYLDTNSFEKIWAMAENGDSKALLISKAAAYQVGKEIGSMATVLKGDVDAIILTGGMAYNKQFIELIKSMIDFIAEVHVFPGEDEMKALASNGLMALNNEIEIKTYK